MLPRSAEKSRNDRAKFLNEETDKESNKMQSFELRISLPTTLCGWVSYNITTKSNREHKRWVLIAQKAPQVPSLLPFGPLYLIL